MGKLASGVLLTLLSLLGAACGQSDDRPGNVHVVGTGGSGGGGGGGSGGGGPCTPDPNKGVKVSGNVITYDVLLADIQPFAGKAELKIAGANCAWVSTTWDGAAAGGPDGGPPLFLLESVKAVSAPDVSFMHIYPTTSEPVYPTLVAAATNQDLLGAMDGFGMVRSAGVDEVYNATGTARDPDKGTVIVKVLGKQGDPLPGVSVDMGTNAAPAYPGLGGWQLGGETDVAGVSVLLNATSKAFPGQSWTVNISMGSAKESFKCPAENGAVTICWIAPTQGF